MAEHHSAMDYPEHEGTYKLFIGMVKYGTAAVLVLMLLLYVFAV